MYKIERESGYIILNLLLILTILSFFSTMTMEMSSEQRKLSKNLVASLEKDTRMTSLDSKIIKKD